MTYLDFQYERLIFCMSDCQCICLSLSISFFINCFASLASLFLLYRSNIIYMFISICVKNIAPSHWPVCPCLKSKYSWPPDRVYNSG